MLTGVPPCDADDVIAVFNKKATEDPRPMRSLRSDVPADIERVVVRALSRRAADRQPSMAALKDDILACLGAIQKTPRPAGGPRHSQTGATVTERLRRLRRPRVLIAAGAGAALVLAGALGISSLLGGRQDGRGRPQPAVAERPAAPAAAPGSEAIAGRPSPAPSPAPAAAPLPAATPPDAVPQTIAVRSPDPRLHMAAPTWPEEDHRNLRPVPGTVPLTRGFNGPGTVHPATGGGRPQLVGAPRGLGANLPARLMRRISPPRARDPSAAAAAAATTEPPAPTPPRPQAAPPPPRPAAGTPSAEAAELLARGRGAFAKGAFPEAVRLGRQTVAAGDPAGGHLLLGDAFYKMDRFPDALREYGAVLEIAPDNAAARRGLDLAAARIPR
jgi:hypothetical protein